MSDRRNPYLILGIDYGSNAAQASAAFALATRRLRTQDDPPYTIEDLTWALHRIEQATADPEASLEAFRVPANPKVYLDGQLDDLLPDSPPLAPSSAPEQARRELEDRALLAELHHDLTQTVWADLQGCVVEPATIDLTPSLPTPPKETKPTPPHPTMPPLVPAGAAGDGRGRGIWWLIALLVLIGFAWAGAESESDRSTTTDRGTSGVADDPLPQPEPQPDPGPQLPPEQAPDLGPTAWTSDGDCLIHTGDDFWEVTACGNHDAEIVTTQKGRRSGLTCPPYTDAWFDDEWGSYCALIVTDDTPEGGHWGIGPVDERTCLKIDRQGRRVVKSACTDNAVPVLTTTNSQDACAAHPRISDYVVTMAAVDGTSNYLCLDRFHWDAAGLPPPE